MGDAQVPLDSLGASRLDGGVSGMTVVGRWTGRESRLLRQALRMSVRGFADHLGVPVRTVSKWEQHGGARSPRPEFQAMLDTVLARASQEQRARFTASGGADPTDRRQFLIAAAAASLTSASPSWAAQPHPASWARPVHDAVVHPATVMRPIAAGGQDSVPGDAARLAGRMVLASLGSNHATLSRDLPSVIGRLEWSALNVAEEHREPVLAGVSDVLAVAAWTLIKADDSVGAWVAAQRAVQTAREGEDALRLAAATRCLAEVHMRAGNLRDAGRVALTAAVYLEATPGDDPAATCLRGASLLSAAAAAARAGDAHEAGTAMHAAERCADWLHGERSDLGTVFGPTNVAIHRVAIAVELGDAATAVDHGRHVDLHRMPAALKERRARFTIDLARAHAQLGDDTAALGALLDAEAQSADETRSHRHTHTLVRHLLDRRHTQAEARHLAERCGLVA